MDRLNLTQPTSHTDTASPILVNRAAQTPKLPLEAEVERDPFRIRLANCDRSHASAFDLLRRMYETRGYQCKPLEVQPDEDGRIESDCYKTIMAMDGHKAIGTLTVSLDGDEGLKVDGLFNAEVEPFRRNHGICEFTRLAMDREATRSPRLLGGLFHVAYLYARKVQKLDLVFIEVNPRHVQYYQQMLGFERLTDERQSPLVAAPAVLLKLNLSHADEQIARFGGRPELAATERSAYPHFFGPEEAAGIEQRLLAQDTELAQVAKTLRRRHPMHAVVDAVH